MGTTNGGCSGIGWGWSRANAADGAMAGALAAGESSSRGWGSTNATEGAVAGVADTEGSWSWGRGWSAVEATAGGGAGMTAAGLLHLPADGIKAANCRGARRGLRI